MIYKQTQLKVADNSGAHIVKCIKIIGTNKKNGCIGNFILLTIKSKKQSTKKKLKKKLIYHGLITMVKQNIIRLDGTIIKCNQNRILIFVNSNSQTKFLGTRIYGPIMRELKYNINTSKKTKQTYLKLLSYTQIII